MKKTVLIVAAVVVFLALAASNTVWADGPKPWQVIFGTDESIVGAVKLDSGQVCVLTKQGGISCTCPCTTCQGTVETTSAGPSDHATVVPPPVTTPPPSIVPPPPPPPASAGGNPGNNKDVGKAGECPNGNCGQYGWTGNGDKGASNGGGNK